MTTKYIKLIVLDRTKIKKILTPINYKVTHAHTNLQIQQNKQYLSIAKITNTNTKMPDI